MPQTFYSFQEFVAQHGGEYIRAKGRLLFPDGAQADEQDHFRYDPPPDTYQRLQLQREYWAQKKEWAVEDFTKLQRALDGTGMPFQWLEKFHGKETGDPFGNLLQLKARAEEFHRKLADILALLEQTPEHQAKVAAHAAYLRRLEEARINDAAHIAKVRSIGLDFKKPDPPDPAPIPGTNAAPKPALPNAAPIPGPDSGRSNRSPKKNGEPGD